MVQFGAYSGLPSVPMHCADQLYISDFPDRAISFYWVVHPKSSQLAFEQWSSAQTIYVWGHCFLEPQVKTTCCFGWIRLDHHSSYQTPVIYKKSKPLICLSISKFWRFVKAWYFHIRALRHIRSSLTTEAAKTIAVAIVSFRLDHCNSLLAGMSASNLAHFQMVQNTLAWVVTQKSRYCHITPVLAGLFTIESISKFPQLLSRYCTTTSLLYLAQILPRYTLLQSLRSVAVLDLSNWRGSAPVFCGVKGRKLD